MRARFTSWMLFLVMVGLVLAQAALTNDAIIKMVKAGLDEDVVLSTIKSRPAKYATDPDDLITLKQAGVSDKVIAAMVEKGSPNIVATLDHSDWSAPPPSGLARVVFYYTDPVYRPSIFLGEREIARIRSQRCFAILVQPGAVEVNIESPQHKPTSMELTPGQTVYLRATYAFKGYKLILEDESHFRKAFAKMALLDKEDLREGIRPSAGAPLSPSTGAEKPNPVPVMPQQRFTLAENTPAAPATSVAGASPGQTAVGQGTVSVVPPPNASWNEISRALKSRDPQTRRWGVQRLHWGDQVFLEKFAQRDTDASVRASAVESLVDLTLISRIAVMDPDPSVREAAVRQKARVPKIAVPILQTFIQQKPHAITWGNDSTRRNLKSIDEQGYSIDLTPEIVASTTQTWGTYGDIYRKRSHLGPTRETNLKFADVTRIEVHQDDFGWDIHLVGGNGSDLDVLPNGNQNNLASPPISLKVALQALHALCANAAPDEIWENCSHRAGREVCRPTVSKHRRLYAE